AGDYRRQFLATRAHLLPGTVAVVGAPKCRVAATSDDEKFAAIPSQSRVAQRVRSAAHAAAAASITTMIIPEPPPSPASQLPVGEQLPPMPHRTEPWTY
ncbi:MAG TPA: hypothetical protein VJB02_05615, partial [Coxiellaceae bacterium]|nr:hypothetical protein [Coxiellaceae bacterium]